LPPPALATIADSAILAFEMRARALLILGLLVVGVAAAA
jgi:hypothetical protein